MARWWIAWCLQAAAFEATNLNDFIARWLVQHAESLVWPSLAAVEDALEEVQQYAKVVSALQA